MWPEVSIWPTFRGTSNYGQRSTKNERTNNNSGWCSLSASYRRPGRNHEDRQKHYNNWPLKLRFRKPLHDHPQHPHTPHQN